MRLLRSFKTEHKRCWTNAGRTDLYSHSVRYNSLLSESESGLTMKTLRPYSIELNCSLFRLLILCVVSDSLFTTAQVAILAFCYYWYMGVGLCGRIIIQE